MAKVTCDGCGDVVDTRYSNALQEVVGWVNSGRARGVNQIRAEYGTGRWRHKACLPDTQDYVDERQGSLL